VENKVECHGFVRLEGYLLTLKLPSHTEEIIIPLLHVDPTHLVQSVATNGQYGNARVQPIMIRKLAGM